MNELNVCWISAGVSSFVAGYLARNVIDKFIYIDIQDQHPDSIRFIKDCEKVLDKQIEILQSPYKSVEGACKGAGVICSQKNFFYPCTNYLKKRVRKEWELHFQDYQLVYYWGMDIDEVNRAQRLIDSNPSQIQRFPLIEKGLTKQEAHGICSSLGIKRPLMYDLGYNNNNCVGCLKGGMGYWNKIRVDFPDVFNSRAKLERLLGSSILKEFYLDELPPDRGRMTHEVMTDCDIFCLMNI